MKKQFFILCALLSMQANINAQDREKTPVMTVDESTKSIRGLRQIIDQSPVNFFNLENLKQDLETKIDSLLEKFKAEAENATLLKKDAAERVPELNLLKARLTYEFSVLQKLYEEFLNIALQSSARIETESLKSKFNILTSEKDKFEKQIAQDRERAQQEAFKPIEEEEGEPIEEEEGEPIEEEEGEPTWYEVLGGLAAQATGATAGNE